MRQQGVWQVHERRVLIAALTAALTTGWVLASPLQAQAAAPSTPIGKTPGEGPPTPATAPLEAEPNSAARVSEPSAIARRLLWGNTKGAPSTAKRVAVYGLYGAAGVATASAAVFMAHWLSDRERLAQHLERNPGACHDLGAEPCQRLVSLRNEANGSASWATTSAAIAASALLGAVMTAHLWDNVEVTTSAWPSGGQTHVTVHF